jgi:hypothetical protein
MSFSPSRRFRLEYLETRDMPSSLTGLTTTLPPTTTTTTTATFYDPTLLPSNPTSTTLAVLITSVGATECGYHVTVTGLSSSSLQPGASLQLRLGTTNYAVSSYSVNQDGSVRLTLANAPGLAEALAQATVTSVIIGNGGNTSPATVATTATIQSPIIDTTLTAQR